MKKEEILKLFKKYKKKIVAAASLICIAILIYIIINIIDSLKPPTSIGDFKSAKQVIEYMGSTYISEEGALSRNIYLKFKYKLYNDDNTSNEKYFNEMINTLSGVLKYNNFNLIDDDNVIYISVECSKSKKAVSSVMINGSENYFSESDSKKAIENYTKINEISLSINSNVLNNVIRNNWNYSDTLFGTKDSYYNEYNIFFDEGIEVKNVSRGSEVSSPKQVFNIVFNSKYDKKIVNDLGTSSSLEEVENKLGKPHFGSAEAGLIGYKSNNLYIFFNLKNEVSVYPIKTQNNNDFARIVGEFVTNGKPDKLLNELPEIWTYYDAYIENSESNSKELLYTLYGVKIQFNVSKEQGVIIYNNFSGNITESTNISDILNNSKKLPNNVYFKNKDLVYENEEKRTFYSIDTQFMKQSDDFIIYSTLFDDDYYNIKFISKNDNYPNSELSDTVNSFEFLDNTKIVYSVKNVGIYTYDIVSKNKITVIEGKEEFNIKEIKDGILYYDNTNVNIK